MKIYIDGKYYSKDEAKISVFDHGLLYGDGIFEGIRIYDGKVFKLKEHIKRLFLSAKALMLELPGTFDDMCRLVEEAVTVNEKNEGYIRLIITRGTGDLGIDPAKCPAVSVIIIVGDIQLYPEQMYIDGISIITASQRRMSPDNFDPRIKSLNYLNNIMAKIEAKQAGCLEAVMLNRAGYVAECTADNIFIIRDSVLYTPAAVDGALAGITRGTVLELAAAAGIKCKECSLTGYDLYTADECFMTGSGAEIMAVTKIDGRVIGSGKMGDVTERLLKNFREYVRK